MTGKLQPWREYGEASRRPKVTCQHRDRSTIQTFYLGLDGLLRRQDYGAQVLGGIPAARYVRDSQTFSVIVVPTRRRLFGRTPDGTFVAQPLIDLTEVEFA